jgi:hypothetical protein
VSYVPVHLEDLDLDTVAMQLQEALIVANFSGSHECMT